MHLPTPKPTLTLLVPLLLLPHPTAPLKIAGARSVIEQTKLQYAASPSYYTGTSPSSVVNGGVADLTTSPTSDIDLAGNAETQGLRSYARHKDLRLIYTVVDVQYRLVAHADGDIKTLADLKGKRIGAMSGTSAGYFVEHLLQTEAGLHPGDYQVVSGMTCNAKSQCGSSSLPSMLARGTIDAVGMWEPTLQLCIESLDNNTVVFQNGTVYRELYSLYTTSAKLADPAKRRDIVAYLVALHKAGQDFVAKPDEVIPRVADMMEGMDEDLVRAVWPVHDWRGGLMKQDELLDWLAAEDDYVARVDGRKAMSKTDLARFIDASVFGEAMASLNETKGTV